MSASQLLHRPGAHVAALSGLLIIISYAVNKRWTLLYAIMAHMTAGGMFYHRCQHCACRIHFTKELGIADMNVSSVQIKMTASREHGVFVTDPVVISRSALLSASFLCSPGTGAAVWSSRILKVVKGIAGTEFPTVPIHLFHRFFF